MTAWLSFRRAWGQDVVTRSRRIPRWSVTKVDEDKARRRSARRGLAPLNPFEVTRPKLLTWLECTDEDHRDNSMTMVDDPDQSSHGWPRGLSNAASSNQCADPGRYQSSLGGAERCRERPQMPDGTAFCAATAHPAFSAFSHNVFRTPMSRCTMGTRSFPIPRILGRHRDDSNCSL